MATIAPKIYLVLHKATNTGRLVRAKSQAAATKHVVADSHDTRLATQDDLVYAVGAGVKVEDASAEAPTAEAAAS